MALEHKMTEREVQIGRYKSLEREVTDPLAAGLLHIIVVDLEADLQNVCAPQQRRPADAAKDHFCMTKRIGKRCKVESRRTSHLGHSLS